MMMVIIIIFTQEEVFREVQGWPAMPPVLSNPCDIISSIGTDNIKLWAFKTPFISWNLRLYHRIQSGPEGPIQNEHYQVLWTSKFEAQGGTTTIFLMASRTKACWICKHESTIVCQYMFLNTCKHQKPTITKFFAKDLNFNSFKSRSYSFTNIHMLLRGSNRNDASKVVSSLLIKRGMDT